MSPVNAVVFDIETRLSPTNCVFCKNPIEAHANETHGFQPLGWARLILFGGISIGCAWDMRDNTQTFFDEHNLRAFVMKITQESPLLVTFNGKRFDGPLVANTLELESKPGQQERDDCKALQLLWRTLMDHSYDVLEAIQRAERHEGRQNNSNTLDAIAVANDLGEKSFSGRHAPDLWKQGRCADVVNYCAEDVRKTRQLFELALRGQAIKRQHGSLMVQAPIVG